MCAQRSRTGRLVLAVESPVPVVEWRAGSARNRNRSDPSWITLHSGPVLSQPRQVVLGLWIRPATHFGNRAQFRLNFSTLGGVRASEYFLATRFGFRHIACG
jgi:hypothetical protein